MHKAQFRLLFKHTHDCLLTLLVPEAFHDQLVTLYEGKYTGHLICILIEVASFS